MIRKSALFAFAAVAALGIATLSSSPASAGPHGFKGKHFHGKHSHFVHRHRWHRPHWRGHWRRPIYVVSRPVIYRTAPIVYAVPKAGPCTCLTKEYTIEGAVLFKDRCTNEMAMNPPALPQQTALQAPVQPQYAPQPQAPAQQ